MRHTRYGTVKLQELDSNTIIHKALIIQLPHFSNEQGEVIAVNLTRKEIENAVNIAELEVFDELTYNEIERKLQKLEYENDELQNRIESLEDELDGYRGRYLKVI